MVCTEYQERINEFALAGPAVVGAGADSSANASENATAHAALQAHLAGCAGCREELARRRALLDRIDFGVAGMVSAEPSPALTVLVRQQIAEGTAASRSFAQRWGWWIGATAAAAAIVIAAIVFAVLPRSPFHPASPQNISSNVPATSAVVPSSEAGKNPPAPSRESSTPIRAPQRIAVVSPVVAVPQREVGVQLPHDSAAPTLEVLIPANQRIALVQLATAAARNQLDDRILVPHAATNPLVAIEVKPLAIDLLEDSAPQPPDGVQIKN